MNVIEKLIKFDQYVVSKSGFWRIILFPYIVLSGLNLAVSISEYINVGVLKNTQGYPWGCKCFDGMENYASPETYSASMIFSSFTSALIITALVVFFVKKRSVYPLLIFIPYTVISIGLFLMELFFPSTYIPPTYPQKTATSTSYLTEITATPTPPRIGHRIDSTTSPYEY